jgi:hypothetical protein
MGKHPMSLHAWCIKPNVERKWRQSTTCVALSIFRDKLSRLGNWSEEAKTLQFGSIWDYYFIKEGVLVGAD